MASWVSAGCCDSRRSNVLAWEWVYSAWKDMCGWGLPYAWPLRGPPPAYSYVLGLVAYLIT